MESTARQYTQCVELCDTAAVRTGRETPQVVRDNNFAKGKLEVLERGGVKV